MPEQLKESKLDLVVAGTKDAVLMVESEASGLTEKQMLDAVKFGHEKFVPIIKNSERLNILKGWSQAMRRTLVQ